MVGVLVQLMEVRRGPGEQSKYQGTYYSPFQVFDGDQSLGDPESMMKLGGINAACDIGYLSELEALRLVEVGSRYKYPLYPIWMLGSPNHYTLLFCLNVDVAKKSRKLALRHDVEAAFSQFALDKEAGMGETAR